MSNLTFSVVKTTLTRNGHEITQATSLRFHYHLSVCTGKQSDMAGFNTYCNRIYNNGVL